MLARGEWNIARDSGDRVWWRRARTEGRDGDGYVARAWFRVRERL